MEKGLHSETLLRWQLEAGVDEAISVDPVNHYHERSGKDQSGVTEEPSATPSPPVSPPVSPSIPPSGMNETAAIFKPAPTEVKRRRVEGQESALHDARAAAHNAPSLEALRTILENFEGCGLKTTATNLVFGEGNEQARIMFVGEAPGADEDRMGRPFVGASGQLFDNMMAAIGLDRKSAYITNILPWRPPGNRTPTPTEIAICLPFIERQIELIEPDILVMVGGISAKTLLGRSEGIMRMRGNWFDYASPGLPSPVQGRAIFHPDYLLGSPAHKREAWIDLLEIKARLKSFS
ncbi:MAG: uracil-DNA glycosylase [Rhodospirillaceae bacterium]|nr:uracil-DNA glycosylase [Rhodospirillaceae bacterium]